MDPGPASGERWSVVTFVNAECDDICPVLAQEIAQADQRSGRRCSSVAFVVVNADPLETSLAVTPPALTQTGLAAPPQRDVPRPDRLKRPERGLEGATVSPWPSATPPAWSTHNDAMDFIDPRGETGARRATPFANENALGIYSSRSGHHPHLRPGVAAPPPTCSRGRHDRRDPPTEGPPSHPAPRSVHPRGDRRPGAGAAGLVQAGMGVGRRRGGGAHRGVGAWSTCPPTPRRPPTPPTRPPSCSRSTPPGRLLLRGEGDLHHLPGPAGRERSAPPIGRDPVHAPGRPVGVLVHQQLDLRPVQRAGHRHPGGQGHRRRWSTWPPCGPRPTPWPPSRTSRPCPPTPPTPQPSADLSEAGGRSGPGPGPGRRPTCRRPTASSTPASPCRTCPPSPPWTSPRPGLTGVDGPAPTRGPQGGAPPDRRSGPGSAPGGSAGAAPRRGPPRTAASGSGSSRPPG